MEIDRENLDQFYEWLKCDGLKPRKSERLWKKTILINLLNDQKMTLDNFFDFLKDKEDKKTIEKDTILNDDYDYTIVLDKTISLTTGNHKIRKMIEAGSRIHLLFYDGGNLLLSKADIRRVFGDYS